MEQKLLNSANVPSYRWFLTQEIHNKFSLLLCFRKKCPLPLSTSTTEKDTEYRSETKNIKFF